MENYQGDLTDIVRASGGAYACGGGVAGDSEPISDWQFPTDPINFSPVVEKPRDNFGDPFGYIRDPLLHHELDVLGSPGFFSSPSSREMMGRSSSVDDKAGGFSTTHHVVEMKRPSNMFSRMLQISPNAKLLASAAASPCASPVMAASNSPRRIKVSPNMLSNDMINVNASKDCFVDNTGMQISSPRNPGIKRRKSQAKKVICIPAPAAANSRPTGEVVPSDLWAWRKYGQKPIKGSPYPRGYYRCSSSKGCSARKQVERNRADPNMLVITYTSEHNHPWPTQRNALAGSTRSQPSKNNNNGAAANSKNKPTSPKEEQKDQSSNEANVSPSTTTSTACVKEEIDHDHQDIEKMDDADLISTGTDHHGFPYRPAMPAGTSNCAQSSDQDFFADLGEIEADPLDLLFTQAFSGDDDHDHQEKDSKGLMDPFSLFDWSGDKN